MSNTAVVESTIGAMSRGDWDTWASHMHPDLRYTILGIDLPGAGTMDKATATSILPGLVAQFWADGSPRLTVERLYADGDWVVVEATGGGSMRDGSPYENHYAMFFELRDGRVVTLREYMDTQHMALTLERVGAGQAPD